MTHFLAQLIFTIFPCLDDADCAANVAKYWEGVGAELFNQHDGWFAYQNLCPVNEK